MYDTIGHGYKIDYQAVIGGGEPGQAVQPDSIPVLRITLKAGTGGHGRAAPAAPEYGDAIFGEQAQQAAKVFAPNDFFGVLPDGTAWVARGHENRVDWRAPDGTWTRGQAPRRTTQVPGDPGGPGSRAGPGAGAGQAVRHAPGARTIKYPFADTKPPFDFALGRPNGEVWLQRPRAQEDAPLTYDVFGREGAGSARSRSPRARRWRASGRAAASTRRSRRPRGGRWGGSS